MPDSLAPESRLTWLRVLAVALVCLLFAGGLMLLVINLPTTAPPHEPPFPATNPITLPAPSGATSASP